MPTENHHLSYRPDIDGLRAFSILAVVIYHTFPALLPGGFVGVDVFFVISGFLISTIIFRGQSAGNFSLAGFYRRRVQRILPALLAVLIFCLVLGWFALLPAEMTLLGKHTAAASIFLPNFVFWTEVDYFDTAAELKPLLHLWSLGVEEQFYLLWPLLLILMSRLRISTPLLVSALFCLFFAINIWLVGEDRAAAFFLPHFRAWELLTGAVLAWFVLQRTDRTQPAGSLLAVLGLAGMVSATLIINEQSIFPGWWALLPTVGAALVILAGPHNTVSQYLLGNRLMVLVGKISYPLYLWHWPLLSFARIMESGELSPQLRLMIILLSFVLSWLTYRLLESPLRYHRSTLVPASLLAALLALGATGYLLDRQDGFPERHSELLARLDAFQWREKGLMYRDDCSQELNLPRRCLSNHKPHQVAVLGDSHSTNVFFALEHHYRHSGTGIMRLGRLGCPPFYNLESAPVGDRDKCREVSNAHHDYVVKNPQIRTVFLSSWGTLYVVPRKAKSRYRLHYADGPGNQDNDTAYRLALETTLERLLLAGKEVVIVMGWPDLRFDPKSCVDGRPLSLTSRPPRECHIERNAFRKRSANYRKLVFSVLQKFPEVKYWDTPRAFCDESRCWGEKDGVMLYRDRSHLSMEGSHYLGEHLKLRQLPGRTRKAQTPSNEAMAPNPSNTRSGQNSPP
jgi:peptidoglycan/LPS O-acetylase OafA/YrhL